MKPAEEFMRLYFDERVLEEQREQSSRVPFRRKFHTHDCFWDSRSGQLEMMHSETVLSLSSFDDKAEVITRREFPGMAGSVHKLRYHLVPDGESWLIREVDMWCPACHGEAGSSSCRFCHGTGWSERKFKD